MRILALVLACALALPVAGAADEGGVEANLTRAEDDPPAMGAAAPVGLGLVLLAGAWLGARVARRPA